MPKKSSNALFFIKLIVWPDMKYIFYFLICISIFSCSRSKGYFSKSDHSFHQENGVLQRPEKVLLASTDPNLSVRMMLETKFLEPLSEDVNQSMRIQPFSDEKKNATLPNAHSEINAKMKYIVSRESILKNPNSTNHRFFKSEISSKIQSFNSQNKKLRADQGASTWEPRLKIGLILIGIGIVLSVFGLGWIAGTAAFIGLIFTIIGLLHTY